MILLRLREIYFPENIFAGPFLRSLTDDALQNIVILIAVLWNLDFPGVD